MSPPKRSVRIFEGREICESSLSELFVETSFYVSTKADGPRGRNRCIPFLNGNYFWFGGFILRGDSWSAQHRCNLPEHVHNSNVPVGHSPRKTTSRVRMLLQDDGKGSNRYVVSSIEGILLISHSTQSAITITIIGLLPSANVTFSSIDIYKDCW